METNEYFSMFDLENEYWWYRALHDLVEHYAGIIGSDELRIFDAGCGTGRMMEILAPYGKVEGIDYSPEAIALCKKRGLATANVGDLNQWKSEPNVFDVIVSLDVIYHVDINDDFVILNKFHQALKSNGLLILNVVAFNILRREHDIVVGAGKRYRKNELLKMLQKIGFTIDVITYRLPYLFLYLLVRKYLFRLLQIKRNIVSDLTPLPETLNKLLLSINTVENKMIIKGCRLLFGSSLFVVARKT